MNNGKQWTDLQEHERKLTGINNLKIGYNNHVFGYYIEVTKVNT